MQRFNKLNHYGKRWRGQGFILERWVMAVKNEESIQLFVFASKKALDSNPNNSEVLMAYITLTCSYSALKRDEDARLTAAELLRMRPNFSLENSIEKRPLLKWFVNNKADKDLLVNVLRKAGLK